VAEISAVDSSLTSILSIGLASPLSAATERVPLSALDAYRVSNSLGPVNSNNSIKIIDITRGHYGKIDLTDGGNNVSDDIECLGIMPVVTTAANAMFYQGLISSTTSCEASTGYESTSRLSAYTPVVAACNRAYEDVTEGVADPDAYTHVELSGFMSRNAAMMVSAATLADQCVAKIAVDQFPDIGYMLSGTVDRMHVKQVGLVVFRVFRDEANDNKLNFEPIESFVGQLDRNAKNERTGASDYIGDIVNAASQYVNLFANIRVNDSYRKAQTIVTSRQVAPILGFAGCELDKHIDYKESVIDPLNMILTRLRDPNQYRVDLVADAGVTNVAAFAA